MLALTGGGNDADYYKAQSQKLSKQLHQMNKQLEHADRLRRMETWSRRIDHGIGIPGFNRTQDALLLNRSLGLSTKGIDDGDYKLLYTQ